MVTTLALTCAIEVHVRLAKKLSLTTSPAIVVVQFSKHHCHVVLDHHLAIFRVDDRSCVVILKSLIIVMGMKRNARSARSLQKSLAYVARRLSRTNHAGEQMYSAVLFVASLSNVVVTHAERLVIDLVTVKIQMHTASRCVAS